MKLLACVLAFSVICCSAAPLPLFPRERLGEVRELGLHKLAAMLERAHTDPVGLAKDLSSSAVAQKVPAGVFNKPLTVGTPTKDSKPIVAAHGMGDSCFNAGMKEITTAAGQKMGVYSVCVPTGNSWLNDTLAGFLVNMDKNVDIFAEAVRADVNLAGGFDAMGFSQGNSVIRGYIQRYNNPPVRNYLSVHGTVMGVSGFPNCDPSGGVLAGICDVLDEVLGDLAYNPLMQEILFQANYYRDPKLLNSTSYLKYSQLAAWNNENPDKVNPQYKTNFDSLRQWIMIRAMGDTVVWPNIGEWWGEFVPGQYKETEPMPATRLFQDDLFGLKTANMTGKIKFNHTEGNHLQFTEEQLFWWLEHHFNE